jgi:hypothetical protein
MALALLANALVVTCSATEHHYSIPTDAALAMFQRRGGAVESPAGGNDNIDDDSSKQRHPRFWHHLGALFELSANAKDQALEAEPGPPPPPRNGGRGGALTVVKPKRRFLSIVMSPPTFLLADKQEPLKEESLVIMEEPTKPKQSMSGISRLWWVTAREAMYDIVSDEMKEQDTVTESTIAVMEEEKPKKSKSKKKNEKQQQHKSKNTSVEETRVRDQAPSMAETETVKDDDQEIVIVQSTEEVGTESIQVVEASAGERESIKAEVIKEEEAILEPQSVEQKSEIDVLTIKEKLVVEVDQSKDQEEDDETELDPGPAIVVGESPYISSGAVSSLRLPRESIQIHPHNFIAVGSR